MLDNMFVQLLLYIDLFLLGVLATIAVQHWYSRLFRGGSNRKPDPKLTALPKSEKDKVLKAAHDKFEQTLDAAADRLEHDLKSTSDRIGVHLEELGNQTADAENKRYRQQLDELFSQAEADIDQARKATKDFIDKQRQALEKLHEKAERDIESTQTDVQDYASHHSDKLELLLSQASKTITDSNQDITDYKQSLKQHLDTLDEQAKAEVEDVSAEITAFKQQLKQQLSEQTERQQQQLAERLDGKLADAVIAFLNDAMQHEVDLGAQADYLTKVLEENKDKLIEGVTGETKTSK